VAVVIDVVLPCLDEAAALPWVLSRIPGAQDIKTPTSGRLPMLRVAVRRAQ